MRIGPTLIEDTFAEAFRVRYARLIVTAHDDYWLHAALRSVTGYATSVIACDAEAGTERLLAQTETPDGRLGAAVLLFGFSAEGLAKSVPNRAGQCLMTCPTVAVYDGLPAAAERVPLGKHIRFFGDGFQKSKLIAGRRYWRIPVMDGEFLVQESVGVEKGVGGGNIILQAETLETALAAARRATEALDRLPGVQRQQGRLALQEADRLDVGRLLPHAAGPRGNQAQRRGQLRPGDRHRRRQRSGRRRGHGRRHPRRQRPGGPHHRRRQLRRQAGEVPLPPPPDSRSAGRQRRRVGPSSDVLR
jgi:hypothetical protein